MCAANPAERHAGTLRDCSNQTSLPSAIPKTSFLCATSRKKFLKVAQETGSTLVTKVTPPDDRSE